MIQVGIADYGMTVWDGGLFDYEERVRSVKEIGYDGLERLEAQSAEDAIHKAARVRRMGMDFATCRVPSPELSIQYTAALGKRYVWTAVTGKDFETFCRQVNFQARICKSWGIEVALHNHLGSLVETQAQLLAFLEACPDCKLVLDTGHLGAAEGGDPLYILEHYFDRIVTVHVKDWMSTNPGAKEWYEQGYFCELGGGNTPIPNREVIQELVRRGFDGWLCVEHDTHLRDPLIDLSVSREFIRSAGV